MVCVRLGKERPDRRQNERRIKLIRVEEGTVTASIVGQLPDTQGEPTLDVGSWFVSIARG